jgi:16S rRNA (uracil1498-N3)-methyltransferase
MTRRRWIADQVQGDRAYLLGDNARHLAQVLRARVGQQYEVVSGESVRLGTITGIHDDRVEFALGDMVGSAHQAQPLCLLQAIFKFDRMEWAIEKATELGVTQILPTVAARTEKHLAMSADKRVERWRKIAREAAQQSRRNPAPVIDSPMKIKAALASVPADAFRLLLSEEEKNTHIASALAEAPAESPIWLACGPEGGWTEQEQQIFLAAGWQPVSLGATILRAETAAIAALAIARAQNSR